MGGAQGNYGARSYENLGYRRRNSGGLVTGVPGYNGIWKRNRLSFQRDLSSDKKVERTVTKCGGGGCVAGAEKYVSGWRYFSGRMRAEKLVRSHNQDEGMDKLMALVNGIRPVVNIMWHYPETAVQLIKEKSLISKISRGR